MTNHIFFYIYDKFATFLNLQRITLTLSIFNIYIYYKKWH
jgi:hypothetical protein